MTDIRCVSCGKRVETEKFWVGFPCPSCGDTKIVRCERCRRLVVTYQCPKCEFEGP